MLIRYYEGDSKEEAERIAKLHDGSVTYVLGKYWATSYPSEEKKKKLRAKGIDPDSMMW